MFGHEHHEENNLPEPDSTVVQSDQSTTAPPVDNDSAGAYIDDVSPLGNDSTAAPSAIDDSAATAAPADDIVATPAPAAAATPAVTAPANTDKLLDIKQQALQQLTPLVGHLEQSPEEKFRTTMMMIQASDNHELVPVAYEAAGQITDEKVRAQALLDIVNEINYFTHNGSTDSEAA